MKFLKACSTSPVLAAILFVVGCVILTQNPAPAQMWKWSKTPANNATADPNINWQEGMPPSAVNDSSRNEMAALANWRDDTSGLLADTGSASAYTVTSNQGLAATPNNGQLICFTPANTNNAAVTLSVDAGGAFPIQAPLGSAVGAGVMSAGTPYCAVFNSANSVWLLRDFVGQPVAIPLGSIIDYTGTTTPNSNFVFPVGQAISRTTFATYFAQVSTTYGTGDGVTTFNVPDLRGRIIAALDNMGGTAASRLTSTACGSNFTTMGVTCGAQNRAIAQSNIPAYNLVVNDPGHQHGFSYVSPVTAGGQFQQGSGFVNITNSSQTGSNTTGISVSSAGGGVAFTTVQPTFGINKILRIF